MKKYSSKNQKKIQWNQGTLLCFIASIFIFISIHVTLNAATTSMDSVRFLLLQDSASTPTPTPTFYPTPTPTPTFYPTPTPTPTFYPTPTFDGFFKNSAKHTSTGLALGSIGGIFFVLRRKDKE